MFHSSSKSKPRKTAPKNDRDPESYSKYLDGKVKKSFQKGNFFTSSPLSVSRVKNDKVNSELLIKKYLRDTEQYNHLPLHQDPRPTPPSAKPELNPQRPMANKIEKASMFQPLTKSALNESYMNASFVKNRLANFSYDQSNKLLLAKEAASQPNSSLSAPASDRPILGTIQPESRAVVFEKNIKTTQITEQSLIGVLLEPFENNKYSSLDRLNSLRDELREIAAARKNEPTIDVCDENIDLFEETKEGKFVSKTTQTGESLYNLFVLSLEQKQVETRKEGLVVPFLPPPDYFGQSQHMNAQIQPPMRQTKEETSSWVLQSSECAGQSFESAGTAAYNSFLMNRQLDGNSRQKLVEKVIIRSVQDERSLQSGSSVVNSESLYKLEAQRIDVIRSSSEAQFGAADSSNLKTLYRYL